MEQQAQREGWTWFLFAICVEVTVGSLVPIGYSFGVVNTPARFIKQWCNETIQDRYDKKLNDNQLRLLMSCIISILLIGGIVGSFFGSKCCDKFGRKGSLLISCVIFVLSSLIIFFSRMAKSVEMLLAGRFICGFSAALVYTAQPMYLVELAPPELSGSVGVFTCIGITGGLVMGQILSFEFVFGNEQFWHIAISGYIVFVVLGYAPFYFFPESPRHIYAKTQNADKVKAALQRVRRHKQNIDAQVAEMEAQPKTNGNKATYSAVLCKFKYKLPIIIVISFNVCQQLSGISTIFYYSTTIFTKAGFDMHTAGFLNFGLGLQNFLVASAGPLVLAICNRRPLMMISCMMCGIFITILAIGLACLVRIKYTSNSLILDDSNRINLKHLGGNIIPWLCILSIAMYILFFNFGLGPIPFFIGAEIFELSPRPIAMGLGSLANWTTNFFMAMVFPEMEAAGGSLAFIPSIFACVYCLLLSWRYLPETRRRGANDVAPLIANGFKSKIAATANN